MGEIYYNQMTGRYFMASKEVIEKETVKIKRMATMNFENITKMAPSREVIDSAAQNSFTVYGMAAMFASVYLSTFGGFLEACKRDPFYSKSNNWRKRHHIPMIRRGGRRKEGI